MTWAFRGEVFQFPSTKQYVLCLGPARQYDGDERLWWKPLPEGPKFLAQRLSAELMDQNDVPPLVQDCAMRSRYGC